MPLYPTEISRALRAPRGFQSARRPASRGRRTRVSRGFQAPMGVPLAAAFAKAGIRPPVPPSGIPLLPLVAGFALGVYIGKRLFPEKREEIFGGGGIPLTANPPYNFSVDHVAAPWAGVPNNSEVPAYSRANTGSHYMNNPTGLGEAMPATDTGNFGLYAQRYFFGNPTSDYWCTDLYNRDYEIPGQVVYETNWEVPGEPTVLLPGVPPQAVPGLARVLRDSDWDEGYKTGDERGPQKDLRVTILPGSPRYTPRAPGDIFPNGINAPIAVGSGPVPYSAAPNVAVDIDTATGAVTTGSGGYNNNPPRLDESGDGKGREPRTKEKKIKTSMHPRMLLLRVFNAWTEANDAVNALWKALPKEVRRQGKGHRGAVSRQKKIEQVYNNFSKIKWRDALRNLVENEIGDFYVGQIGQLGKRTQRNFEKAGYSFGGPTFGTRLTKQTGVGRAPEWSLPEWDL